MNDIFIKTYGSGKPIIMLHGFCETNYVWQELAKELQNEFRIICPDLPGFGQSELLGKGFSIEDVAKTIVAKLDLESIDKAFFIGHSLGGYVTLSIVHLFPGRVQGFCLLNSSAYEDSPVKKDNRNKLIGHIDDQGVKPFIRTFVPSLFFHDRVEEFEANIKAIKEAGLALGPETIKGYAAAMRDRKDHEELLKNNPEKAMIIAGEEDQNVPVEVSKKMGALVNNENFHLLPASAHMSMYEQKVRCAEILRDFVNRITAS